MDTLPNETPRVKHQRLTLSMTDPRPASEVCAPERRAPKDPFALDAVSAVLWRGKQWVIAAALAAGALGLIYAKAIATPIYTAQSVVMLETREEQILDLDSVMGGLSGDASVVNSEVEVLRSRGLLGRVVDRLALTEDPAFNSVLRGQSRLDRLRALVTAPAVPDPSPDKARDRAINHLLNMTEIRAVPNSLVFRIKVHGANPTQAAQIADMIAEIYVRNQLDVKFQATEQATAWLADRVTDLQSELEAAEAQVTAFNARTELISPEVLTGLERQLKDMRERSAALAQAPETARSIAQLAALALSQQALEAQVARQSEDMIALSQLTREAEATRLLYEHFLTRLKETSAQQGIQQADSRILSQAVVPGTPTSPDTMMFALLAAFAGVLAASGVLMARELRDTTFRSATGLEGATGQRVIGQIPLIPAKGRRAMVDYLVAKPASAAAEAVRNLRTSVLLANADAPPQVILSTSSLPGEGKTTNALALAQNLVGLGKSVVLIEGDIRRARLGSHLGLASGDAMGQVINGAVSLDDALQEVPGLGLHVLSGMQAQINAADLFSSTGFHEMIRALRQRFDMVIIDSPPVLVVPDARILAQMSDCVLFTVRWNHTSRAQLDEAMRLFETSGQRVSGLILSQIDPKGLRRYGYGGQYGTDIDGGARYYQG